MDWKTKIKNGITTYNPLAVRRRNGMRRALTNQTPSLLVPNCMGGILFHDLGIRFQSPLVNLMMFQTDFVKLACGLDDYLEKDLVFFPHPEYQFPCAKLGDLTLHFTHYHTEEEARRKWRERSGRINRDNLFLVAMERDGLTEEDIRRLGAVPARGILVFTAHDYPDIPYALHVPQFSRDGVVDNILARSWKDDHRKYEEVFDFVKWFNEADGQNHDISTFVR